MRVFGLPVRCDQMEETARLEDPPRFTHERDRVEHMLKDVRRPHLVGRLVGERPWEHIEVVDDVDTGERDRVDVHGVRVGELAAAEIDIHSQLACQRWTPNVHGSGV